MIPDSLLTTWLDGGVVDLVAPFTAPSAFVLAAAGRGSDVVVVTATDADALITAASGELGLLLRTTARADRDRWFARPAGRRGGVVTSVDSLHSPTLRAELAADAPGVPWVLVAAERLSPAHPLSGGRLPWVAEHREACAAGGLVRVHRDPRGAPEGTPVVVDAPGRVRVAPRGDSMVTLLAGAGGGVLLRRPPRSAERTFGEAGLPLRVHRLDRLRARDWEVAAAALRKPSRGLDALKAPGLGTTAAGGRWTVASRPLGSVADLLTDARGGWVVASAARLAAHVDEATSAEVDEARAAIEAADLGAGRFALSGDQQGVAEDLLFDLEAVGVVARLRPTCLTAVVADQRRFRPPFTDRSDAYRRLYADYVAAAEGWSLTQQAELGLTDRAPRDLRSLARALGWSAADLCDVLVAMNLDSVVTVRLQPAGGERDWEGEIGEAWGEPSATVAERIEALRVQRRRLAEEAGTCLGDVDGCRLVSVVAPLGIEVEACGACESCAPDTLPTGFAPAPERVLGRAARPQREQRLSPGALFAGLDAGARERAQAGRIGGVAGRVRAALGDPEPGPLAELVAELGSGHVVVAAAFQRRHQGLARDVPEELVADAVEGLLAERGPRGLPATLASGTTVRRGPKRRLELHRTEGLYRGVQALVPVDGVRLDEVVARVAEIDPSGPAGRLRATAAGRARWQVWLDQLGRAVQGALDASPELPATDSLLPEPAEGEAGEGWSDLFALVALGRGGSASQAAELAALAEGPGIDLLGAALAAVAGEWARLWDRARRTLRRRDRDEGVVTRLGLRALLGLEAPAELSAEELATWLDRVRGDAAPAPEVLDALVDRVSGGSPAAFGRLAEAVGESGRRLRVARRALELGRLSRGLAAELLSAFAAEDGVARAATLAEILVTLVPRGDRGEADAAWGALGAVPHEVEEAVVAALRRRHDPPAEALVAASARRRAKLEAAAASRERLRAAGAQGKLQAFGARLARVLAPSASSVEERAVLEQGTREALEEAHRDGWSAPILKVLRAQVRRHPTDPARTLWLARALAITGHWAEAERAFQDAADAADGLEARRDVHLEAAEAFFRGGQPERAVQIVRRLIIGRPDRALAGAVGAWVDEGAVPRGAAVELLAAFRGSGSGVYAAAIRALESVTR